AAAWNLKHLDRESAGLPCFCQGARRRVAEHPRRFSRGKDGNTWQVAVYVRMSVRLRGHPCTYWGIRFPVSRALSRRSAAAHGWLGSGNDQASCPNVPRQPSGRKCRRNSKYLIDINIFDFSQGDDKGHPSRPKTTT